MRMLSALDASFIYLESDHSPMHIGSLHLIDARDAPGHFDYGRFVAHVARRLRRSRVFRERLVEAPFGLTHPCWINDPDFDLGRHLSRLQLPPPGGISQLMQLCSQLFGQSLSRDRPLWEMHFVEGLNAVDGLAPQSFAIVAKVHHAAVDGVSGMALMGALLDDSASPEDRDEADPWQPEQVPAVATMLEAAYARLASRPAALRKLVGELVAGARKIHAAGTAGKVNLPPMPFTAPASVLNRPVSSSRTYCGVELSFERLRHIRQKVAGVTFNDVALAICAGGLRAYLEERGALPAEPLVTMVPIALRPGDRKEAPGNEVAATLVSLATDVGDPVQRLLRIHHNSVNSKQVADALPANRLIDYIPSEALAAVTRLYTRLRVGGSHRPLFNLVITNVPGPVKPVYLAGARVKRQFGTAPIIDGLGLTIVVLSYAGTVTFGLTSCYGVVPDPERLAAALVVALNELEEAFDRLGAKDLQDLADQARAHGAASAAGPNARQRLVRASAALDDAIDDLRKSLGR